ncbi:MAG: hypothetical protein ACKO2N_13915 [Tabrizicola sp.]
MLEEVSKRPGGVPVGRFFISFVRGQHEGVRDWMTVRFTGDVTGPEDVLGVTERLYEDAVIELERTMKALKAGEFNEVKSAQDAIRALRATALAVLQERGKVDQLRKQIAGHVGAGGALDLESARAEIGRRLACLRHAGGS